MSNEKCCDKCYGEITETVFPPGAKYYGCTLKQECPCHTPSTDTMEERFDERFGVINESTIPFSEQYGADTHKDFIRQEISLAVADERKKVVEEIQVIADTTPPNLLLNAIVSRI